MIKSNITGWKDVFTFTLVQTLKNKAFIISYVILLTLAMVSMPLINMLTSGGIEDAMTALPVKKVYVNNESSLPDMDFSELLKDEMLSHISFELMLEEYEVTADRIEETENEAVILTISENEGMYSLNFVKASKGPIKEINMHILSNAMNQEFEKNRFNILSITEEQIAMLKAEVATKVTMTNVDGAPIMKEDTSITLSEYWVIYGILFVVLMVNVMASTQIATSIVTEKSTRVMEYLLTSVKPLALMVGKIIAMLSAVLLQMTSMVVILFASNKISTYLSSSDRESVLSQYLPNNIFENLTIINIVLCIILVFLGMLFYATLAGLAGATVSRIEEMGEGLTLFTITNLVGSYIGIGAASVLMGSGINGYVIFSYLFPLSSPFVLPGAILVGKASMPIIAAAIVLQILFIMLLFRFVAKVYETLILHNGNKIKLKELFKLSKTV